MPTLPITDPTWIFLTVLALILFAPLLAQRLRVPAIVGLIVAGVCVGPHGFGLLSRDASFAIFGKVGLYYIMFLASLEMKLRDVLRQRWAALTFGLVSFALPALLGYGLHSVGYASHPLTALLVAAILGSHTLLTYPIVMRWGLGAQRAVGIAVGGTIVTYVLCLLTLAVAEGIHAEGFSLLGLTALLVRTAALGAGLLLLAPRLARWFFRRFEDSVLQYLFVLALVFAGAGLMEWVGMEGILGAFVVGLVLNRCIPHGSPLMSHIEFVGSALFVPYFLIGVGMLVNIGALLSGWSIVLLSLLLLLVGALSKWGAASLVRRLFGLSSSEGLLITGLSTARASATLAIALKGYELLSPSGERLIDDALFNAVMLLILGSSVIASFASERAAAQLVLAGAAESQTPDEHDTLLLALRNEKTLVALTNLALLLRRPSALSTVTAVSVVLDDQAESRSEAQRLLDHAAKMTAATAVRMNTLCRWAVNIATGLSHTARETQATDILLGLHEKSSIADAFLGKLTTDLISNAPQQILIYRPLLPVTSLRRLHILVPPQGEFDPGFRHWLMRVGTLSNRLSIHLTFHSAAPTLEAIAQAWAELGFDHPIDRHEYAQWADCQSLKESVRADHMVIFVSARRGMPSHASYLDSLPQQIERHFSTRSLLIIVPRSR